MTSDADLRNDARCDIRRHLRFGWWSLLAFLLLGFVLEIFHALKIGWYLNVAYETRRMMFILAHTHGTLLALVNIAFAATLHMVPELAQRTGRTVSHSLIAATILLPGGFFLGGIVLHGGDPGLGVLLVPLGALLLIYAVFFIARRQPIAATPATDELEEPLPNSRKGRKR